MKQYLKKWLGVILLLVLLVVFCVYFKQLEDLYYRVFGTSVYGNVSYSLPSLTLQHIKIVAISSFFVVVIGIGLGLISSAEWGKEVRGLLEKFNYLGQIIPTIALLTFLAPILGMGTKPAIVALISIGILPIYTGVVTGLENVPRDVIEVARGIGMSKREVLTEISLPLAMPVIVAGLRIALVINISAATLAARIGAGGLGIPIFDAMRTGELSAIVKGTIPICLMAFIVDRTLKNIEDMLSVRYKNG